MIATRMVSQSSAGATAFLPASFTRSGAAAVVRASCAWEIGGLFPVRLARTGAGSWRPQPARAMTRKGPRDVVAPPVAWRLVFRDYADHRFGRPPPPRQCLRFKHRAVVVAVAPVPPKPEAWQEAFPPLARPE
jgi:hypothetical protein